MSNQIKKVRAQLLDSVSKSILSEIIVEIKLLLPQNGIPEYQIVGFMGYKPELSDKSHILQLSEQVTGEIFISIDGLPDLNQTRYKIYLQGNTWNNLEWYKSLPS